MKLKGILNKGSLPGFQKSLFREGFRQLRAAGIVYTVISALVSLRFILPHIDPSPESGYSHVVQLMYPLSHYLEDLPLLIFVIASIFAVFASFYVTTFMRSAKARDFYCSTPHSHGTLWLNFASSALAWTAAGVLVYFLISCVLLMPFDPRVFGMLFFIACNVLAAVWMVFGMTMLAISLTGRLITAIASLAGISMLSFFIKVAFSIGYGHILSKFGLVAADTDLSGYDPVYYVLKHLLWRNVNYQSYSESRFDLVASWSTLGYCALVGAVMLAAAAIFSTVRTGDDVGRPFVNEAAHVISLTAVSLPLAVVFTVAVFETALNQQFGMAHFNGRRISFVILGIVFLAGCFWAAELLLTFDIRRSHIAFRWLPAPFVIAVASLLIGYYGYIGEFNTVPAADEVESFTLVRNEVLPDSLTVFRMEDTFGRWITNEAEFTDGETIRYVTGKMKALSDAYGHDMKKANEAPAIWENEETGVFGSAYQDGKGNPMITLRLNLKNGKHLLRTVAFDEEHVKALESAIKNNKEFMNKFLTLPSAEDVIFCMECAKGLSDDEAVAIYGSFVKEYNALSDSEKLDYINGTLTQYSGTESYYDGSQTDLNLISKSKKTGDYAIAESYLNELPSEYSDEVEINVMGYPEGHLYDGKMHFDQWFTLSGKTFPETVSLIVRTCNAKFDKLPETIEQYSKEYGFFDIDARYFSSGTQLDVTYRYLNGSGDSVLYALNSAGHHTGDDERYTVLDIEVDSNEMVRRLFKDTAATQTVDLSKPYCRFVWNNFGRCKELPDRMTFYAQTDNPVEYLRLLPSSEAQEDSKTDAKGKKY